MTSPQDIQKQLDLDNGTRRITINKTKYSINMLPALPAALLGAEIMETLIPAAGNAVDNGMNHGDMFPEDRAPLTQIAMHLVKGIKDLDKVKHIDDLLEDATANGVPLDIHNGMRGKAADIAFLVEFALRENLEGFFTDFIKERVIGLIPPSVKNKILEGLTPSESSET